MNTRILCLSLLSATLGLSACSVKTSGGGDVPNIVTPDNAPFENLVEGPKLEGKFESGCDKLSDGRSLRLSYEFKGKNVTRSEDVFKDATCSQIADYRVQGGSYRFTAKFEDDIYEIEYRLPGPDGFKDHRENLRLKGDVLEVTYQISGQGRVPDHVLKRVGSAAQPPVAGAPQLTPVAPFVTRRGQIAVFKGTEDGRPVEIETQIVGRTTNGQVSWIVSLTTISGSSRTTDLKYYNELTSSEGARRELADCTKNFGKIEVITVPAGTFETCMTTSDSARFWTGNVPVLGVVKMELLDGSKKIELVKFEL